jgi:hypothetical protein
MARTIKLKVAGTDIVQEYALHDTANEAHRSAPRQATIIAFIDPRDHEVYFDWIPVGQPLPVGSITVRDSGRDGRNRFDESGARSLLWDGVER